MAIIDAGNEGNLGCPRSTVENITMAFDGAVVHHVNGDEMIWIPNSDATIHATFHRVLHKLHSR
jgi:hypothetical protein